MTKKLTEKYNDACIKMFTFLKMLYKGDVEFKKVIDLLSDGKYDGTSNTHVTLNKYLNAMRIFGIKVKKIKNKYHLFSTLSQLNLSQEDIKSILMLKKANEILPDGKVKNNFNEFIHELEIRYDDSAKNLNEIEDNTDNLDFEFYNSEMAEQIKLCEKYCQDKQKLEIIYINPKGEETNLICSPLEQIYLKRKICLKALGNNGSRIYEIPVENIKSLKQLPISVSSQSIPTTVVYKIKNRLAKNYKLRDWERLDKIETDNSRIIVNKNEDLDLLVKRLMRYGTECEILSPKFLKEEMIDEINKTLGNY